MYRKLWFEDIMFSSGHGHQVWVKNYHESDNNKDPYAVAVMRRGTVIGHVPRKISALSLLAIVSGIFLDKSFEKCLTAFVGPCSAANFPICALSSGVYSLYLPHPEVSCSRARFTSVFAFSTCLS